MLHTIPEIHKNANSASNPQALAQKRSPQIFAGVLPAVAAVVGVREKENKTLDLSSYRKGRGIALAKVR